MRSLLEIAESLAAERYAEPLFGGSEESLGTVTGQMWGSLSSFVKPSPMQERAHAAPLAGARGR